MRKLSGEIIAKIKTLYRQGKSERAIAKAVGCSRSAVWYQLQKAKAA
jgi:DNA invertase Pin-like site-specific DNA recombinase